MLHSPHQWHTTWSGLPCLLSQTCLQRSVLQGRKKEFESSPSSDSLFPWSFAFSQWNATDDWYPPSTTGGWMLKLWGWGKQGKHKAPRLSGITKQGKHPEGCTNPGESPTIWPWPWCSTGPRTGARRLFQHHQELLARLLPCVSAPSSCKLLPCGKRNESGKARLITRAECIEIVAWSRGITANLVKVVSPCKGLSLSL